MTSSRPYLIRALNDWIIDNGMSPHLLVDANMPDAIVPWHFVEDGKIVLNISPAAVRELYFGIEKITFSARFGGQTQEISVPVAAVRAIYARENGKGMVFPDEPDSGGEADPRQEKRKPELKIIK